MFRQIQILIWGIVLIIQMGSFARAQTSPNTLQDEVDEAEARAKIAKARKEELDSRFPKPDRGSLVGGTSVNGDIIEAKMLGYCAMKTAAKTIAAKIVPGAGFPTNSTFIVYNETDVKMVARYQLMIHRLIILEGEYTTLYAGGGCPNALGVIAKGLGVGLGVNKALEFLSLLKTDIDITGSEINISEKEVVAEVFRNLHRDNYTLYYPQKIPLSVTTLATVSATGAINGINSPLFEEIIALGEAYDHARNAVDANKPARNRLDELYKSTMKELGFGETPSTSADVARVDGDGGCPGGCSQTTNVNVNVGEKDKAAGGGGGSDRTFFSYLQAEKLYEIMKQNNSNWIDLQVVKAGGNMRVKSNFITNFMIGSRVNFSGAAIIYFNVFNGNGVSKLSGVVPAYEKYRKSHKIIEKCEGEKLP